MAAITAVSWSSGWSTERSRMPLSTRLAARPIDSTPISDHNGGAETVAGENTSASAPSRNTAPLIAHTRQNNGTDICRVMPPACQGAAARRPPPPAEPPSSSVPASQHLDTENRATHQRLLTIDDLEPALSHQQPQPPDPTPQAPAVSRRRDRINLGIGKHQSP